MSELIESAGSLYLNCEQYNDSDVPVDCEIKVSDRDDILSRQDRWAVHITRFAVDTQSSLFYVPADPTATLTITSFNYVDAIGHRVDQQKHFIDRRTLTMTNGASTLADFLQMLNDAVPSIEAHHSHPDDLSHVAGGQPLHKCGKWNITASGAFKFQAMVINPTTGQSVPVNDYAITNQEYFVNLYASESMRKILGFKDATLNILGNESNLATFKKLLVKFQQMLPSYRRDVKNWRWEGTNMEHKKCPWYADMWYVIHNIILEGIPVTGHGAGIGTVRTTINLLESTDEIPGLLTEYGSGNQMIT